MKLSLVGIIATGLLIAGCNQNTERTSRDFNELPPAVQKTVRAQAPDAEIVAVHHSTQNGGEVYEVEFRSPSGGKNPRVVVAPNGTLLSTDLANTAGVLKKALTPTGATGTPFSALPLPVQRTIQEHSGNAVIADISRHESNGRAIYRVEFQDKGKNPSIEVAEDGTLVQGLQK